MARGQCPVRASCRYRAVCKDHKWFCVWAFWGALAGGFTLISFIVWKAAHV